MAAANRIALKYGLESQPTKRQTLDFHDRAKAYLSQGISPANAGEQAARETFPDFRKRFYKSEADTLEMLLRLIEAE